MNKEIYKNDTDFTFLQHKYLDERFIFLEKMLSSTVLSQEKIATFSKEAAEKVLQKAESLAAHNQVISNEFRGQLKDQASTFITRLEVISRLENIDNKIVQTINEVNKLREYRVASMATVETKHIEKTNNEWMMGTVIALLSLLIAVVAIFFSLKK